MAGIGRSNERSCTRDPYHTATPAEWMLIGYALDMALASGLKQVRDLQEASRS